MSEAIAMTELEPRLIEGLENMARVLQLPRGTDVRRVRCWIKKEGLPAWRVRGKGPYMANRTDLLAWWAEAQTSAENAGDGR